MTMSRQQVPSCLVGYHLECCVIPCLCGQLFDDNVQVNSGVLVMSYRKCTICVSLFVWLVSKETIICMWKYVTLLVFMRII